MTPLHGLVFGYGHMGRLHASKLEARPDIRVTVIDPAQGLPARTARPADFAVIATPTSTHLSVALPLLESGTPCLVEKPLASTLPDAQRLAAYPHLAVGFIERFNPALAPVLKVRPRFIQAERLAPLPPGLGRPGARGTDVDVVRDLMIHDIDLLNLFLSGELVDVRALGVGVVDTAQGVDIANARIELSDGVGVLTASRVSRQPVRTLRLVEQGVYWSVDLLHRTVHRVRWGEGQLDAEPVPVPQGDALDREHDAFLTAVRGQADFPSPGPSALRSMEQADIIVGHIATSSPSRSA